MRLIIPAVLVTALFGCTTSTSSPEEPTRDEARALSGKSDHIDICAWLGWYDDGFCDEFCPEPDPDCSAECREDADCPEILCFREPCPQLECVAGSCEVARCFRGDRWCQTCGDSGFCTSNEVSCPLVHCDAPYNPCEGRSCGDFCQLCPLDRPDCAETAVLKYCQADGSCSAAPPMCD